MLINLLVLRLMGTLSGAAILSFSFLSPFSKSVYSFSKEFSPVEANAFF